MGNIKYTEINTGQRQNPAFYDFNPNDGMDNSFIDSYKQNPYVTNTDPNIEKSNFGASQTKSMDFGTAADTATGVASGIMDLANLTTSLAKTKKASDFTNSMDAQRLTQGSNSYSMDDVMSQYLHTSPLSFYSNSDFRSNSAGQDIMGVGSGMLIGAKAGTQIMPGLGTIIGAIVGGGAAGAGIGIGRARARKEAEKANQYRQEIEDYNQNTLAMRASNAIQQQAFEREQNFMNFGGVLNTNGADFSNGISVVGNGGSHSENPFGGIQIGMDEQGVPNLVEEGEIIWNKMYAFSPELKNPLTKNTFAKDAIKATKEAEERPNDPISKRGMEDNLMRLAILQEETRMKQNKDNRNNRNTQGNKFDTGGFTLNDLYNTSANILGNIPSSYLNSTGIPMYFNQVETLADFDELSPKRTVKTTDNPYKLSMPSLTGFDKPSFYLNQQDSTLGVKPVTQTSPWVNAYFNNMNTSSPLEERDITGITEKPVDKNKTVVPQNDNGMKPTWMRYPWGTAINVMTDLMGITNRPDYTNADAIANAAKGFRDVTYTPLHERMSLKPIDFMQNQNAVTSATDATRRAIANQAGGNRASAMAGLLALNNQYNQVLGKARQADIDAYNNRLKEVLAFNSGIDEKNNTMSMTAQQQNNALVQNRLNAIREAAELRERIEAASSAGRSANLNALNQSMMNIGKENMQYNWLKTLADSGYFNNGKTVDDILKTYRR